MSEIQADGADHENEEVIEMEVNYPDWFLENQPDLDAFLELTHEERSELVSKSSGLFGTVLSSLSTEGTEALVNSGNAFAAANFQSLREKYSEMGATDFILMLLGVTIECMGIQQLKLEKAK